MTSSETTAPLRFSVGDRVLVDDRPVVGHCRTPSFVRGRTGIIAEVHGGFRDPERLAYHRPGLPALTLYKVRFKQSDVWSDYTGPASDDLEVDIYDNWLSPAAS